MLETISRVNWLKTIWLNFTVLPFKQAIKLPLLVGRHVEFKGLHKGCIKLNGPVHRFAVWLGVPPRYPIYPNKREYSMYRCSKGSLLEFELGKSSLQIYNGFSIVNNGHITIGRGLVINQHCTIYCNKEVTLGRNCRIGWNSQILDSDLHLVYDAIDNTISNPIGKVAIGDNVWIANSCHIMKGSIIPDFSIITARSLVNKDFSAYKSKGNVFAGTPAKHIKDGKIRLLDEKYESELKDWFITTEEKKKLLSSEFDYTKFCKLS